MKKFMAVGLLAFAMMFGYSSISSATSIEEPPSHKELKLSETDVKLFGVCGGLGEYFGVDPWLFRFLFLFLFLCFGTGVLLYLILALLM